MTFILPMGHEVALGKEECGTALSIVLERGSQGRGAEGSPGGWETWLAHHCISSAWPVAAVAKQRTKQTRPNPLEV